MSACGPVGLIVDGLEWLDDDARHHECTVDHRQRLQQPVGGTRLLGATQIFWSTSLLCGGPPGRQWTWFLL